MRASLPHPLRERRRPRAGRRHRASVGGAPETSPGAARARAGATVLPPVGAVDRAAQRVRDAGGPIDEASYACHCGFIFRAPVSTTVACPHCFAPQAW
jgi:hypothetical protein